MPFDISTAVPVEKKKTGFDITTAKPVTRGGFDMSTAQPVTRDTTNATQAVTAPTPTPPPVAPITPPAAVKLPPQGVTPAMPATTSLPRPSAGQIAAPASGVSAGYMPLEIPDSMKESGQAFATSAVRSVGPNLVGMGAGSIAGAVGAALAPETGGFSLLIPLLAAVVTGGVATHLTRKGQDALIPPGEREIQLANEHPWATKLGSTVGPMRFSPTEAANALKGVKQISALRSAVKSGQMPMKDALIIAKSSAQVKALANSAINAGVMTGTGAAQRAMLGQPTSASDVVEDILMGTILNKETLAGKAFAAPGHVLADRISTGRAEAKPAEPISGDAAAKPAPPPAETPPAPETVVPTKENENAQAIRSDTGQPDRKGSVATGSKTDSNGNVQRPPQGQPDATGQQTPAEAPKPALTPEAKKQVTRITKLYKKSDARAQADTLDAEAQVARAAGDETKAKALEDTAQEIADKFHDDTVTPEPSKPWTQMPKIEVKESKKTENSVDLLREELRADIIKNGISSKDHTAEDFGNIWSGHIRRDGSGIPYDTVLTRAIDAGIVPEGTTDTTIIGNLIMRGRNMKPSEIASGESANVKEQARYSLEKRAEQGHELSPEETKGFPDIRERYEGYGRTAKNPVEHDDGATAYFKKGDWYVKDQDDPRYRKLDWDEDGHTIDALQEKYPGINPLPDAREKIVGTALNTPNGPVAHPDQFAPHEDIAAHHELASAPESQRGFIAEAADGTQRFVNDRYEAGQIARDAGQVGDEVGALHSHNLRGEEVPEVKPTPTAEQPPITPEADKAYSDLRAQVLAKRGEDAAAKMDEMAERPATTEQRGGATVTTGGVDVAMKWGTSQLKEQAAAISEKDMPFNLTGETVKPTEPTGNRYEKFNDVELSAMAEMGKTAQMKRDAKAEIERRNKLPVTQDLFGEKKAGGIRTKEGTAGAIDLSIGGLDKFAKEDVSPFVKNVSDVGRATRDLIVNTFAPTTRARRSDLDTIMEGKGHKEAVLTKAAGALEESNKAMEKLPQAEQVAFVDRVKTGKPQPTPELQQVADLLRTWDDRLYDEVKAYRPGATYLENHLRVLWKVIPGSPEASGMSKEQLGSKRPWEGSKGFLKRHVLDDMSEGLEIGGVPVTYNPIEMFMLHAQDAMKFVAANRAWAGLKKTGAAEFVKTGEVPPPDYARLNDSIAKGYFKEGDVASQSFQGKKPGGEWWVHEGAARLLNNYLSRDHIRSNALGRGLMDLKMATTAMELGMSPFHAVFETNEVIGSSLGLGLSKITSGQFSSGAKDIATSLASPVTTAKLGGMAIRYAKNQKQFKAQYPDAYNWFEKNYPSAPELISDLFTGGGKIEMHEDYRIKAAKGFQNAVKEGNVLGAVVRAVPAINQKMMQPLFETYIPRFKVGMFLREQSFELQRQAADIASGKVSRAELARKTWNFVEDRFGELNWDNLFWDRTFKSGMQLLFRSVTWKLGNIRGFGKAIGDTGKEIGYNWWKEGRAPRLTLPMGWVVGMTVVTAVQSAIISKVTTGKYPWELAEDLAETIKNLVFPRIDDKDKSQRVSIATYLRDAVNLGMGGVSNYVKSSMTGEVGRLVDLWNNKDFYGTQVYNPDDPWTKQQVSKLEHLIPLPFGIQSYMASKQSGATTAKSTAGFFGYTKAPYYMSHSPAEIEAMDIMRAKMPQGSRTQEEFDKSVKERRAVAAIKRGDTTVHEAFKEGLIPEKHLSAVEKKIHQTSLQYSVSHGSVSPEDAVRIAEKASPRELNEILKMVKNKIEDSKSLAHDERKALKARLDKLNEGRDPSATLRKKP